MTALLVAGAPGRHAPFEKVKGETIAGVLGELHSRAFAHLLQDAPAPGNEHWDGPAIATSLKMAHNFALLAVDEARTPLGFVLGRWLAGNAQNRGEGEIITLAVDPARRRAGVGSLLVAGAIELAAGAGGGEIFLEVAVDNGPAIALYEKAGFVRVARRKGYYVRARETVDALVMKKPLSPS